MKTNLLSVVFIFIINFKFCQSFNYTNHVLYNVIPIERYQLEFLQNLEKQKYIDVIFWTRPNRVYDAIQILVPPRELVLFKERMEHFHLNGTVLTSNVQKLFNRQKIRRYTRLKHESFSWDYYYDLESVYQWMSDIALKYSDRVKLRAIGKSNEGRDILAFEINTPNPRGKVIVDAALHGNEWVSTVFVTYLANQLIQAEKSTNWRLKQVASRYHWFIVPVANPDGYDYSMKVDRLWRKNRKKTANGTIGVDLNGNFDYSFCLHGGSMDMNSQYYCGPKALSEPETVALSELITYNTHQLNCYFSFHAYGQKIIIPYSDRVQHIENFLEMNSRFECGRNIHANFEFQIPFTGKLWETSNIENVQIEWRQVCSWHSLRHIRYALSFYLRDNGSYGYALPSDKLMTTCKETLVGLLEVMTVRHRTVERELFSTAIDLRPKFYILLFLMTFVFC